MRKGYEAFCRASALVVVTFRHEVPHSGPERLKDALSEGGVEEMQPEHKPRLLGFSDSGKAICCLARVRQHREPLRVGRSSEA